MKILVLSNLYPPHQMGGYERRCAIVVEGLRRKGHDVRVLTSSRGCRGRTVEGDVHRALGFFPGGGPWGLPLGGRLRLELRDNAYLRRLLARFRPDVVHVWQGLNIAPSLIAAVRRSGVPVLFDISDYWIQLYNRGPIPPDAWVEFWKRDARRLFLRLPKRLARRALSSRIALGHEPIAPGRCYFTSRALRDEYAAAGHIVEDAPVIHCGIEAGGFAPREERRRGGPFRLLCLGRMIPEKGLHTAVEAAGILRRRGLDVTLDLYGFETDPGYAGRLRRQAAALGVGGAVRFMGFAPEGEMAGIFRRHDAFLFPSEWKEPFAVAPLEAFAAGLPVVGTAMGGSAELFADGENSLVFPAGDAAALAEAVERLMREPGLAERLARAARALVERAFTVRGMVDRIEEALAGAAGGRAA
jgi:glycosyltransferase involved in cell wall biosynthesis